MHEKPVRLVDYDSAWPVMFEAERSQLAEALQPWLFGPIEHIGSTAVPGLTAKPVVDIMAGVQDLETSRAALEPVARLGYMYFPYRPDQMHWFCKPSPAHRTHHLHLVPFESQLWAERLAFRDSLRRSPDLAATYAALKRELATRYEFDREAYTDAKSEFVHSVVRGEAE